MVAFCNILARNAESNILLLRVAHLEWFLFVTFSMVFLFSPIRPTPFGKKKGCRKQSILLGDLFRITSRTDAATQLELVKRTETRVYPGHKICHNCEPMKSLHYIHSLYHFRIRDGALVRALASHQWSSGSIPGLGVICGLSLLLVLVFALKAFSPGTSVFPSPQKLTFLNPIRFGKCPQLALCAKYIET